MSDIAQLEARSALLVPRAQAGDAAAREELLARCHGAIRRWVGVLVADPDDVDDVAQEVLIRVALRLGGFAARARFTTWPLPSDPPHGPEPAARDLPTAPVRLGGVGAPRTRQRDRPAGGIGGVRAAHDDRQAVPGIAVTTSDSTIADVEATLRRLFRFRGYRLVEEGIFSATEGGEVTQQLGRGGYLVGAEIRRVSGPPDSAIVELAVRLSGREVRFGTQVGVPVGKTAVLGNVGEDPRGTLILTVQPELISVSP